MRSFLSACTKQFLLGENSWKPLAESTDEANYVAVRQLALGPVASYRAQAQLSPLPRWPPLILRLTLT